ncbi:MAG TPA: hypothetical protein VHC22_22290 [Pirellulales bacterium]|nr:hypothetical protein [Pirellulales bacterium]
MSYANLFLTLAIVAFVAPPAAQDAQTKSRQGAKYQLALAKTYHQQSHDHVRMLQKYAALGDKVPAEVVTEHAAAIRYNTDATKRAYGRLVKSAGDDAELAKRVEEMQARLDKVSATLKELEANTSQQKADSKAVAARAKEITQQLRSNHVDLGRIDNDFYDSDSDSYYETGEGHFVD